MTTTIDSAGRVVIPRPIRDIAGLRGGDEIEIEYRDGKIEIETKPAKMLLKKAGKRVVIVAPPGTGKMPADTVESVRRSLRAEREKRVAGQNRT